MPGAKSYDADKSHKFDWALQAAEITDPVKGTGFSPYISGIE